MADENSKSFVENIDKIDFLLERQRKKWMLKAINWMDYDDVKQIIRIHIFRKMHLWNKDKSFEPWVSTIINNQIKNLLRNNYKNFARPCLGCPHNAGGADCTLTISGEQDSSCSLYKKWSEKKQSGYNMKLPVPLENHIHEIEIGERDGINMEEIIPRIKDKMRERLNGRYYTAFKMLFIETKTEEEVADYMGYRTNEKNRKAGYKQIKNLKDMFRSKIIEILENEDIIY
jgi:RNA polymerase sigma factor (sigma-70 family)